MLSGKWQPACLSLNVLVLLIEQLSHVVSNELEWSVIIGTYNYS